MKITFFAFGAKSGAFGDKSKLRIPRGAACARSHAIIELNARPPKPSATSRKACLRVCNLLMRSLRSIAVQKIVRRQHRLEEEAQAFLRLRILGNGLLRDCEFFRGRRPRIRCVEGT